MNRNIIKNSNLSETQKKAYLKLLSFIPEGSSHPISQKSLILYQGVCARELKIMILNMRLLGIPIASRATGNTGYFIAVTDEEKNEFFNYMHARATTTLRSIRCFRSEGSAGGA